MATPRRPSPQAIRLLGALLSGGGAWRYGYEISRETAIGAGTLYPLLERLLKLGFLESEWRPSELEGRPPRHAYRLTHSGAAYAREWQAKAAAPQGRLRGAGR